MRTITVSYTTDTAGAATEFGASLTGKLYALEYRPGTTDTGATVTVTAESDTSHPLLVKATAGTSNVVFYPRVLVHSNTDGAALTGTSGGDRAMPIVQGRIKVVIASGGSVKAGKVVLFIDE